MKTFEQRKAEIFCRAQIQKEKEKQARVRAWKIGISTAFCLCVSLMAVLYLPDAAFDAPMAEDAESKGNVSETTLGNTANNPSGDLEQDGDQENNDKYYGNVQEQVPVSEGDDGPDCVMSAEDEESLDCSEETTNNSCNEECKDEIAEEGEEVFVPNDELSEIMGGEVVVARVERVYEDYLYDTGLVALVPGECLYGRDEFVKLALPISYQGMLQTGDVLIVLLDKDSPYDIPLHEDAVYIIGKTENPFEELAALDGFDVEMDTDEVLAFFADFSK